MKYIGLLLLVVVLCCQLMTIRGDESSEREATLKAVVRGVNTFSKELYQKVKSQSGNLVVSPFSVSAVLAMLLLGLRGDTATQVSEAIHMPADRLQGAQGFKSLLQSLETNEKVTLEIANKIYMRNESVIKSDFIEETEEYFQSVPEKLDIWKNPRGSESQVNQWASEKTHGKIQQILPPGSLKPETVLILLNAIYFKGMWERAFRKVETRDKKFHITPDSDKDVSMMYAFGEFLHVDVPDYDMQAVRLPYQGGKHSMVILLPNKIDGLEKLESKLGSLEHTDLTRSMWRKDVILNLPKFKIENRIDLNEPLTELGMKELFNGFGNFSGITYDCMKVSKAIQKAYIEVNEEGTEAAAVTGFVDFGPRPAPPPPPPVKFIADHPFMYMIVDGHKGTILFMGRVLNPAV